MLGNQRIPIVPRPAFEALARRKPDAALTGGIRPEAFQLATDGAAVDTVHGTVEHVEYLGHETLTHVRVGDSRDAVHLTARLEGMHTFTKGEAVNLRAEASRIYLFDEAGELVRD